MSGRDQPVPSVVPLAAHDDRAATVAAAQHVDGGARHRAARPLHEQPGGDAPRLRLAIEGAGLLGREDRLHSPTATANATAFVRSWVKVISTRVTPSASARRLAFPSSTIEGAPLGRRLTWMSCQRLSP